MAQRNQYPLSKPPNADNFSLNLEQVGLQFGLWVVMSPIRLYTRGWSGLYVHALCTGCGIEQWTAYTNLARGLSGACNACGHERQIPLWLWQRFAAARQRCTNPKDPAWKRYGGRGIEFRFDSVTAAGIYMIDSLGLPDRSLEVDRENNMGHYEPGNLRWATGRQNRRNTRRCKHPVWNPTEWPFSQNATWRRLAAGMTRAEVIADAWVSVSQKRKNWRGILAKLESMTSLTQGLDTDSR